MTDFKNLKCGDTFSLPSGIEDEWIKFVKLNFNKARNVESGEVNHFSDLSSVWTFE